MYILKFEVHKKVRTYNPKLKALARKLRNESTLSEVLLWNELKSKRMLGYDFHRQKPIGEYIVDFFCPRFSLVVEIDGVSHDDKMDEDKAREVKLEMLGLHVLRFSDDEVKQHLEGVVGAIKSWIEEKEKTTHPLAPSR